VFVWIAGALVTFACVTTRPSSEPLGWGTLPPGALTTSDRTSAHRVSKTVPHTQSNATAQSTGDGPVEPEKSAAVVSSSEPSTSASSHPSTSTPATSPPKSAALAAFVGEFAGEDVATYRISGLPDRTERDPKARITVKTSDGGDLLFVLIDSSNGKEICTLSGTPKDSSATIAAGQKCFEQNEGEASAGATVTKGTATMENKKLLFELALDFEMTTEGRSLRGSLDYHFEGKRQ
jgi:hypothetical protein